MKQIQSIDDLTPDNRNAILGTEHGRGMQCICENCRKIFYAQPNRIRAGRAKNCCLKCSYASRSRNAKRRVMCACLHCGKIFYVVPSRVEDGRGKYCGRKCRRLHLGEMKTCPICCNPFWAYKKENRIYCSRECANLAPDKAARARASMLAQWDGPATKERLLRGISRRSESVEWRNAVQFQRGAAHLKYKGNRTARVTEAGRYRYKRWHRMVLVKADHTCALSGLRGGRLEAHHIRAWADYPAARYGLDNGIALSVRSHRLLHRLERSCQLMG